MALSFKKSILVYTLAPITLLFGLFEYQNLNSISEDTTKRIDAHMTDLSVSYANIFNSFLSGVEGITRTTAALIESRPGMPELELYELLELQAKSNPLIFGVAAAFKPYSFSQHRELFAPFVYRITGVGVEWQFGPGTGEDFARVDIAAESYNYTESGREWWEKPVNNQEAVWTEPYIGEKVGNLLSTFAVPIYTNGIVWGVATVDIPLNEISQKIQIPGMAHQEVIVISSTGNIILHPDTGMIGKDINKIADKAIQDAMKFANEGEVGDVEFEGDKLRKMIAAMTDGRVGKADFDLATFNDEGRHYFYFAPMDETGWSFAVGVAHDDIYAGVVESFWYSLLFFCALFGLVALAIVMTAGKLSGAIDWLTERCQRIQRMDFQPASGPPLQIQELKQMSGSLDTMARALESHIITGEDVRISTAIRKQSIPRLIPEAPGFDLAAFSESGERDGGEIYDVFPRLEVDAENTGRIIENKYIAFLLVDDSNTGIVSVAKTAQLRAIYRTLIRNQMGLSEIVENMNEYLMADTIFTGPVDTWLGLLDVENNVLSSISLGFIELYQYKATSDSIEHKEHQAVALSVHKDFPRLKPRVNSFEENDFVVVLSEGIIGALNTDREPFSHESLQTVLRDSKGLSSYEILEAIKQALDDFVGSGDEEISRSIFVIKRL